MPLRTIAPYKPARLLESAGRELDARFMKAASPGARMIWSDGWGVCGAAAFAAPAERSTRIEVVRLWLERPYVARVASFDAESGRILLRDDSYRATGEGCRMVREIRHAFPDWKLIWAGEGAKTPVAVMVQGEDADLRWSFVKLGMGRLFVEMERILTREEVIELARGMNHRHGDRASDLASINPSEV